MTSLSSQDSTPDGTPWQRFNDEFFSLQAGPSVAPDSLIGGLFDEGIELIVDARLGLIEAADAMKAGCDLAGLYYVPTVASQDASDVVRYANLALRHKTCVVFDENAEALLAAIAAHRSIEAIPLDPVSESSI